MEQPRINQSDNMKNRPKRITVSPITRSSGQLSIQAIVKQGRVVNARVIGGVYRGYETIMVGRDPFDAAYLTEKICGICSTAHAMVSSLMLEQIYLTEVPPNGWLLRNLMLGAEFLQNHLRHFYFLELPDYLKAPPNFPFFNSTGRDYRFTKEENDVLWSHYQEAVSASRMCHDMLTLFGAKVPHPHGLVPGGSTVGPRADTLNKFAAKLAAVQQFIETRLLPDTHLLADTYPDYFKIGQGPENFLSYGGFLNSKGQYAIPPGVIIQERKQTLDIRQITEANKYTWLSEQQTSEGINQPEGRKQPEPYKPGAYTWVEAPRYANEPMEVGPLARAIIRGETFGSSTMDRVLARSYEADLISRLMSQWLGEIEPEKLAYRPPDKQVAKQAFGALEVPRGSLLHRIRLESNQVAHYQIITPSEWNFSPKDDFDKLGPVEQCLIGIPIEDPKIPIEVGRVVRSFDPCLYCATHIIQL